MFHIHLPFIRCSTYTLPFQTGFDIHFTVSKGVDIHFSSIQGSTYTTVSNRVWHSLSIHTAVRHLLSFQTGFHIHFPFIRYSTHTLPFQTGFDIHFTVSKRGDIDITVSNRFPHILSFHTVFHIHFTVSNGFPSTFYRLKQGSTFLKFHTGVSHTHYTSPFQTAFRHSLKFHTGVSHTHYTSPFQTAFDIHFTVSNRVSKYFLPFQTGFEIHFSSMQCYTYTLTFQTGFQILFTV